MNKIAVVIILLILLLIFYVNKRKNNEQFTQPIKYNIFNIPHSGYTETQPVPVKLNNTDDGGHVRLYEDFDMKVRPMNARFWQFPDSPVSYKNKYIKAIIPIKLKSYDIKVPKFTKNNRPAWMSDTQMNKYNDLRKVEIFSIYPQYINASSSTSSVYSSIYNDPYVWGKDKGDLMNAFEANTGRYKKIISVKAGEHKKGIILEPVRKVIIFGAL